MKPEVIAAYKRAGKIAKQARAHARSLCVEGALAVDIAEKVEAKIRKLGGALAFPVDISINEIAAHYSPIANDKLTLKKGDLVKIDLGVHINGYIADTATSISIGKNKENEELIKAAEKALDSAIKILKPGVEQNAIGRAISGSLKDVKIINNLRGHSLEQYTIHAGISISNFETSDNRELKDIAIAIEPFTTNGSGWVVDAKPSGVFAVVSPKPLRGGKVVLEYITKKYKTLPFSLRELIKEFGALKAKLAIREMLARGVVREYDVLREKTKQKVAQAEHTVLILDSEVIVTTK